MPDAPSPSQADWARPLHERQIAVLGQLAEAGLDIALSIQRQVKAAEAGGAPASSITDPAAHPVFLAYARVARAVRLSLMLQTHVIKALQALDEAPVQAASAAAKRAEAEREKRADQQKARVERIVERVARRQDLHEDEVERLVEEAGERLDQDDLYGDVLARPASELVDRICKDLGLDPDWPRLSEEAWAREEMTSGEVGWPLADRRPDLFGCSESQTETPETTAALPPPS